MKKRYISFLLLLCLIVACSVGKVGNDKSDVSGLENMAPYVEGFPSDTESLLEPIIISFSESVFNVTESTFKLQESETGVILKGIVQVIDNKTYKLNIEKGLRVNKNYLLLLESTIVDYAGNSLYMDKNISFKTLLGWREISNSLHNIESLFKLTRDRNDNLYFLSFIDNSQFQIFMYESLTNSWKKKYATIDVEDAKAIEFQMLDFNLYFDNQNNPIIAYLSESNTISHSNDPRIHDNTILRIKTYNNGNWVYLGNNLLNLQEPNSYKVIGFDLNFDNFESIFLFTISNGDNNFNRNKIKLSLYKYQDNVWQMQGQDYEENISVVYGLKSQRLINAHADLFFKQL